jgi:hypothetical protein
LFADTERTHAVLTPSITAMDDMTPDQDRRPEQDMPDDRPGAPETPPIDTPDDPVEQQSDESFPASDPPSFTGSTTE